MLIPGTPLTYMSQYATMARRSTGISRSAAVVCQDKKGN